MRKKKKFYHIVVSHSQTVKAGRDRFSGVMRYAAAHNDWIVHIAKEGPYDDSSDYPINDNRPDGIIGQGITRNMSLRRKNGIPFVAIDDTSSEKDIRIDAEILIDNKALGRAAADMFLRAGLRSLAFVGVSSPIETFHQALRCKTFNECAAAAGVTCCTFIPTSDANATKVLKDLAAWLVTLPIPCGIMAYDDRRAQMVIDACHMMHLKIPDQIQIIGVDNEVEICENVRPTLTSIQPDFYGAGYLAAQTLDHILTDGRPRKTQKATYGIKAIIIRESTQDLKGGGRLVSRALEFIRLHAHERLSVRDVACALNVSRRTLEIRFLAVQGHGVANAIRKTRLERVRNLLVETNRTISEIALDSGFASPTHLAGLFKRTFGITMGEWRVQGHLASTIR